MRHMRAVLTSILAGGLLLACSSTAPRTVADIDPLYRPTDIGPSGGRDFYVVLRGAPLAMQPAQFEQLVLNNMQGQNWGPRTNFTTRPVNYDSTFKVVMLFNGPNSVSGSDLCRNPGAAPFRTGPQQEMHVLAVFCRYDQPRTKVDGYLKADASGVSPDGFAQLIQQVTRDLFPGHNPNDPRLNNHNCHWFSC